MPESTIDAINDRTTYKVSELIEDLAKEKEKNQKLLETNRILEMQVRSLGSTIEKMTTQQGESRDE